MQTRAQLIILNERLAVEVAKVTDTTTDDLFRILMSLQALRDELASQRPETLSGTAVTDDFDRLLCVVDGLAQVARRAAGREPVARRTMNEAA